LQERFRYQKKKKKNLGLAKIMVLHISFVLFGVAKLSCQNLIVLKKPFSLVKFEGLVTLNEKLMIILLVHTVA